MKALKIVKVPVQGFCGGVRHAIKKAEQTVKEADGPVYMLGSLVHNRHVNDSLQSQGIHLVERKGATRLELLDGIESGTILFTAHGVSNQVRQKAREKGLACVDASCPFVLHTQNAIRQRLEDGYEVLYVGKQGHPEAEAVYTEDDRVHLVTGLDDIPAGLEKPVFVTNQTTMSALDVKSIFEAVKQLYPDAVIEDEICHATRVRQEAVLALEGMDVLVVVGDPSSNNTRQLAFLGKKAGIPKTVLVEEAGQLEESDFEPGQTVAVTSGASTPDALTAAVIARLQSF